MKRWIAIDFAKSYVLELHRLEMLVKLSDGGWIDGPPDSPPC